MTSSSSTSSNLYFGCCSIGIGHRKDHSEGGSLPLLTFYFDFTTVRLDNLFTVKKTDAEPFTFCCLERLKKRTGDEFFRHPTTVIGNRKDRPVVCRLRPNTDLSPGSDGFVGIEEEIEEHFFHLRSVNRKFRHG